MPADARILGLQPAPWIPCQIGPKPNPTSMTSRSALASFNWATAVETSVAPGVIDAVLATVTLGAAVLSDARKSFISSVCDGELSVMVVVPNAAVAPVSGVETPSLIAPGGMGANFDAAVVPVAPVAPVFFFDELPQAASTIAPAAPIAKHDTYRGRLCMNAPRFPESGAAVPPPP